MQSLGMTGLSKSQVSEMAKDLDEHVESFRTRRLDETGPFTFVAADALVLKVREGGRVVAVHAMSATGVNGDGRREILGLQAATSEDGAGWPGVLPRPGCPGPFGGEAGDLATRMPAWSPRSARPSTAHPGSGAGPTMRRT